MPDLRRVLRDSYGVRAAELHRIPAGTNTVNYRVVDEDGRRWFAKVYRGNLERERAAIELTEFVRRGRVPVPEVRRTLAGDLIDEAVPMSLWEFVEGETAEGGLTGPRWPAVGTVVGRLHRRLSEHPAATPTLRPAVEARDVVRSERNFDRLIASLRARASLSPFEEWACEAAQERRALLGRAGEILEGLPDLTVQVLHGDLASPNLMLRDDTVAAVIDFHPGRPNFTAWEIARIGCDPRTVILGDQWIDGLGELLLAYRDEHPAARVQDLTSTVAVGCAYTLGSTFPLAEPPPVGPSLEHYARARHQAALVMLERLPEVQEELHDRLGPRRG
ncbi:phosphotransferase enzyme family protein [Kribbella shirazensis]|uniref:Homoserine kinase type II n=1 Tax=Kribbella shirazensis TaxID=1105143 RepID=A0A7X6A4C9_9ACTN|nr:phosphotransferase [Kribbella shirazensis]NIK60875.1 homoserine kinase type II [Kribbella shirazensis]